MKILKSWLQDHIDIEKVSAEEIADNLNKSGSAVEELIYKIDSKVVVAEIRKIEAHPNADRLRLATVFNGETEITVVCGAPNIEVGQKVPFAQLGSMLPGDFEIKKASIRGVESCGMICAEDELGLGQSHEGILVLPEDYVLGTPLNQYIESDVVFDLDITPNKSDCLSHVGIARELSALLKKPLVKKEYEPIKKDDQILINIENPEFCREYYGCIIKGVKIGPSPDWLKNCLKSLGAKSINNVVDITNFIMLDLGQPLHAFDLNKIKGGIVVRAAKENEKFTTLDGIERELPCEALLISDHEKPIALAGIMGGLNSEISDNTVDIFLESAEFDRKNIRRTAKMLNLTTDASYRYERGIDSANLRYAMEKAANLIVEVAGGTIMGQNSDGNEPEREEIAIAYDKINNLLGLELKNEEINEILSNLGFVVKENIAVVPSWRHDIAIWQDLAEEVGRIYGYNNIMPIALDPVTAPVKPDYFKKAYIKDLLTELSFTEAFSYAFMSSKDLEAAKLEPKNLLEVANPIQPENKYLRSSLIPNLLKAVAKNPSFDQIQLFEIGEVFTLDQENTNLAAVSSGKNAKKLIDNAVNTLIGTLNIPADLLKVTELSRDELIRYKIKKPVVFYFELNLSALLPELKIDDEKLNLSDKIKPVHYRPISKYPSLTRDLAFIVDQDTDANAIIETIFSQSELVARVELFDEFVSDKFGQNKKNVAFHLNLQKMDKTLTDSEADIEISNIIAKIQEEFNANLRDK